MAFKECCDAYPATNSVTLYKNVQWLCHNAVQKFGGGNFIIIIFLKKSLMFIEATFI